MHLHQKLSISSRLLPCPGKTAAASKGQHLMQQSVQAPCQWMEKQQ
jgi:hypothetical protein